MVVWLVPGNLMTQVVNGLAPMCFLIKYQVNTCLPTVCHLSLPLNFNLQSFNARGDGPHPHFSEAVDERGQDERQHEAEQRDGQDHVPGKESFQMLSTKIQSLKVLT